MKKVRRKVDHNISKWNDAGVTQPTHKSDVLVKTNEDGNVYHHIAQYHNGDWVTRSEELHYVTQWMELPN